MVSSELKQSFSTKGTFPEDQQPLEELYMNLAPESFVQVADFSNKRVDFKDCAGHSGSLDPGTVWLKKHV